MCCLWFGRGVEAFFKPLVPLVVRLTFLVRFVALPLFAFRPRFMFFPCVVRMSCCKVGVRPAAGFSTWDR